MSLKRNIKKELPLKGKMPNSKDFMAYLEPRGMAY
jgi:hypothetical protein